MTPWADLSSAARLDAILVAVHTITVGEGRSGASAAWIASYVERLHPMEAPRLSHHGKCMSQATRVTPGITALRNRGLIGFARRPDRHTGTADALTREGHARVCEILAERSARRR